MMMNYELSRRLKTGAAPIIGLLAICYFSYHLVQGDRGLFAYIKLQNEIQKAEATLQVTEIEKSQLEKRVKLLDTENLDLDMLEERARDVLGLAHPDEVVIYPEN